MLTVGDKARKGPPQCIKMRSRDWAFLERNQQIWDRISFKKVSCTMKVLSNLSCWVHAVKMLFWPVGNMAHMLNHSCQPNCFSRVVQITNKEGETEEHVVIFAGEDVLAGQELTYNYRFSSTEELPCNCSALQCCGLVNATGAASLGYELVHKSELKSLKQNWQVL